jgi:hypothetical protein
MHARFDGMNMDALFNTKTPPKSDDEIHVLSRYCLSNSFNWLQRAPSAARVTQAVPMP